MATDLRTRLRRWAAGATAAVALAAAVVVTAPAPAASAAITGDVQFTGHGWGHGRGLGQWGAYGYAVNHAWPYDRILSHYYGGTVQGIQPNGVISVNLVGLDAKDMVVTSGRDFSVGGVPVSAGAAARVTAQPDGSFLLSTSRFCGAPLEWTTTIPNSRTVSSVPVPGSDLQAMLTLCTPSGTTQYRGELSMVWAGGAQHTVNHVWMEDYLRGVVPRESPASWGDGGGGRGIEALKAQAVAARSYAWAENRSSYAKTCDTTTCQVYLGAGSNLKTLEDPRTDAAIGATSGVVLRSGAAVVRAEFSSSTGGWTAGGAFPAIADDGDVASPYHDWTQAVPATTIADAFGVGTLTGIRVVSRNGLGADGGRVTSVEVSGTTKTVVTTGATARTRLGLRSDWFTVQHLAAPGPGPVPTPVAPQLPTVFQGTTTGTVAIRFGDRGDVPLACDWNGDGVSSLAVFRRGTWFVSNDPAGPAAVVFDFGQAGDQPVCGDWDGDGRASGGLYRNGTVFLRNLLTSGAAERTFWFGAPGDTLIAGDWDGNGQASVGVWRNGIFHLTQDVTRPTTDASIFYGAPGDQPVAGDWDGNRTDTVAVRRGWQFFLRNSNATGIADTVAAFGDPGDKPLSGTWTAGAPDTVGVSRGY